MGRSPLVRRPIRAQIRAQDVPRSPLDLDSPEKVTFPRRFPRLGREFQAKIARPANSNTTSNEQASRPPPDLMSVSYPHISQVEEQSIHIETNVAVSLSSGPGYGVRPERTSRGGLLLHRPSEDMDRFQRFTQPLFQSDETPPPAHVTAEAWNQRLIHLHSNTSPQMSRNRNVRAAGCQKRKRVEENMVWGLEQMLHDEAQQKQSEAPRHPRIAMGEDDSRALEYLHRHHNGDVAAAELIVLVEVSSGRATKVRKCFQKKFEKDKVKLPPPSSSESWRKIYERTIPSVLGQVQDDSAPSYPIRAVEMDVDFSSSDDLEIDLSSDADDLKGAWRSVLACGKSLERQLNGDAGGTKKPLLSTVISFIRNAYGLPVPESCFGSQHVMIEELSNCLLTLLSHVDKARQVQAMLSDTLYDEIGDGVDVDALQKSLDTTAKALAIRLDEADFLYRFRDVVTEWEGKVESILASSGDGDDQGPRTQDDLDRVLQLTFEAEGHGFGTKGLVQLKSRIRRAHQVRERIAAWKESCRLGCKNSTKLMSTLVRDATRLKLVFPELTELMEFNRLSESWVDRATIAIRSRISLSEMKSMIQRGENMPLDLSDYLEKLKARASIAEEWIASLEAVVPCPTREDNTKDLLAWMQTMRIALRNGEYSRLHELSSEGSRIPVDVEPLKLLQVELEAKTWSIKTSKWTPSDNAGDSKKGKLEDIREHVGKAQVLRDKLPLSEDEKKIWVLDGELQLQGVVEAADTWLEKNKPFLEGDNRRSQVRSCISIAKLRQIVDEGNSIHANIGNATSKISRILAQAEAWYEAHEALLVKCNMDQTPSQPLTAYVTLSAMTKAVESAASDVALDLDEAVELKKLLKRAQKWFDRASAVAPKRSKRNGRIQKTKGTVEDLVSLIEEASLLPVNTQEEVHRLQIQLSSVQTWISHASHELERIASGFQQMRENINLAFGPPKEFSRDRSSKSGEGSEVCHGEEGDELLRRVNGKDELDIEIRDESMEGPDDHMSQTDSASTAGSELEGMISQLEKGDANVHRMIKDFRKGAKESGVVTAEADLSEILDTISRWCARSIKYLDAPREIFDKRFFGAFDRFVSEGKDLVEQSKDRKLDLEQKGIYDALCLSWGGLVADQLCRLEILRGEREHFTSWCDSASQLLADEKKLTVEKLKELAEQSRDFPALSDMVQRVRGLAVKVSSWVASAKRTIQSGKKFSLQEAKSMFDAGEKLNVNCHELRVLRAALRAARGWANRVKRCNLEQGCIHVNNVKDLIKEHGTFLIEMPEELSKLKQATRNYCVCRRPYDGFMIGCDECDEWYHGPCIGVSESRADRFDKYVCTRCSVSNVFKNSASAVIGVIRKWTSKKDLKKARQVESQKHQRKVRKETKDIENFRKTIKLLEAKQSKNEAMVGSVLTNVLESEEVDDAEENTDSAPSSEKSLDGDSGGDANSDGVESKLRTQRKALQLATERLAALSTKAAERKQLEMTEMNSKDSLKKWGLKVRSLVMVPSSQEQAQSARPLGNGSLSGAMCVVIGDAQKLGIEHFADVDVVVNAFKCMSWSLFALAILRRKPNEAEMNKVVSLASALKLPEEKGLRTMKAMLQRASQAQIRVQKALAPKPGLTRPYKPLSMDILKELASDIEEIPLEIPEAAQLQIVILDKGARHCICAGPSDGSFMLCCDKCELWFHGHCVNVTREASEGLNSWLCAECLGDPPTDSIETSALTPTANDSEIDYPRALGDDEEEIPHAPNPANMWPPFGLLGSEKATEALGECAAIADDANLDSPKKPARKSQAKADKIKSSASPKLSTAATPKVDTVPSKRSEEKVETPTSAGGVAKAEPSGTPRKTYRITESGMIQLVIEHDLEAEPEIEQPSASQATAGMETLESSDRNASSPRNSKGSRSTKTGKPSPDLMEVESPPPQPVGTKSADEVVAMDIEDTTSFEITTRPPAIDIADTRGEHKLNCLHASTSFAEVSLDPSSTTTEVREAVPVKDEPSSSGFKTEASDALLLASLNILTGGECFANIGATSAVETDKSVAPPPQIALPVGMTVGMRPNEVGSSTVTTNSVNSPREFNMEGSDKNDAESDDDRLEEVPSELPPAVPSDLLVAVKETST